MDNTLNIRQIRSDYKLSQKDIANIVGCRQGFVSQVENGVISHALGHGNNTVTDIYINFDYKKVDAANRKVIDYVLYDKK
jgi:predicted transcriptional regulator